jgi:hypothetical protein
MLGLFFVHISPDPRPEAAGRMLIKTGIVKSQVGADRWLLQFDAKGYKFANVFRGEQLENFGFFETALARQEFISELIASNAAPPVIEEPPASIEAP